MCGCFLCRYKKSGHRGALAPLLPLTFIVGYQGDLAYGSKMDRIRGNKTEIEKRRFIIISVDFA